MRDLYNDLVAGQATLVDAADAAGTVYSAVFDRLNGGNPVHDLVAVATVGSIAGTTETLTVTLIESDSTDSTASMTAVDSADVQGTIALTEDGSTGVIGYLGTARYVAAKIVSGATVTDGAVVLLGGNPRDNVR